VRVPQVVNAQPGEAGRFHHLVCQVLGYSGGVKQPTGWTRLRRFLVLAFLAWLVAHRLTGGLF
jgi:hypothetical protein